MTVRCIDNSMNRRRRRLMCRPKWNAASPPARILSAADVKPVQTGA
jgi:hypothetical protein